MSPVKAGKGKSDKASSSKDAELKQDIASSPRANRARGKIKQLIKPVQHPTSQPKHLVNSLDLANKVDNLVPSTEGGKEETDAGLSDDNVSPEQAHKVQKGWEKKAHVARKTISKDGNSEQRKQTQSKC